MKHLVHTTLLALSLALPAAAQVRREANAASLVNPAASPALQALFDRSGLFMIAGGVLPSGHIVFLLEQNGATQPVAPGALHAALLPDGTPALVAAGATYRIGMPEGLACPLGKFVSRGGVIAYTIPRYKDPRSLMLMHEAGLAHHRVAREFAGTPFEALLRAADFGATEALPPAVTDRILASINQAHGLRGLIMSAADDDAPMVGSFINSDLQMTYHVYLQPASGRVEIGGVPLRYYWKLDGAGAAGVFGVEIFSQNWPAGSHLTDLTRPNAQPTQYDIVNLYQVAALFRALHETNSPAFNGFVAQACGVHA